MVMLVIQMVNLAKYVKAPPPGTRMTPMLAVVTAPFFRALERVGVVLHNTALNKTEIGLMDKRYNKNIHGPYCHDRYYGTLDTKLMDVKLGDLSSWFGRRDKSIGAMWNEISRNFYGVARWYYTGPQYVNMIKLFIHWMLMVSFAAWLLKWPMYTEFRGALYEW